MSTLLAAAKDTAPTHSHPRVPGTAMGKLQAGPPAQPSSTGPETHTSGQEPLTAASTGFA